MLTMNNSGPLFSTTALMMVGPANGRRGKLTKWPSKTWNEGSGGGQKFRTKPLQEGMSLYFTQIERTHKHRVSLWLSPPGNNPLLAIGQSWFSGMSARPSPGGNTI